MCTLSAVTDSEWTNVKKNIKLASEQKVTLSLTNTIIDEVRLYPANAQMTTYTYDLLIGMTSRTNPNGIITYYEYDDLDRLEYVKDQNGHILKKHAYHFSPAGCVCKATIDVG